MHIPEQMRIMLRDASAGAPLRKQEQGRSSHMFSHNTEDEEASDHKHGHGTATRPHPSHYSLKSYNITHNTF